MDYDRINARRGVASTVSGKRHGHYDDGRGGEKEWESSFSQILTRTKQNINRVNEKYGTGSTIPVRLGHNDYGHAPQAE